MPFLPSVLEISAVRPWTEIDSLSVLSLVLFGQSFDLADIDRSNVLMRYRAAGATQGFGGNALFFEDTIRIAPFDAAATVPNALPVDPSKTSAHRSSFTSFGTSSSRGAELLDPSLVNDGVAFIERLHTLPHVRRAMRLDRDPRGSNAFVIAARLSATGRRILTSDPHLQLPTPAVFYEIQLHAPGIEVIGASFPGSAGVPSRILIVPRRNWGPLFSINATTGVALSVQYAAMSGHCSSGPGPRQIGPA